MIKSSNSALYLLSCLTVLLLLPVPSLSADPDQLQDFCVADLKASMSINGFPCKPASKVSASDFFFDLSKEGVTNTSNLNFSITSANVLTFPAVNTLGIAMNRVDYGPGGLNPPHSHPRASESGVIIKGRVLVGFVTTQNVYYSKVLKPGEIFVIPRGLVHFQKNVGKGKALAYTSFNSHLPGAVTLATTLFGSQPSMPNEVLTQAFRVEDSVINTIKSKFGS
ncbi:germin-like protein subfamily T member 2 [Quercus lobata]|uniref:Germin-like protein n=1 Tax=Quercus lobata TaxID=97700 RepID=A0A7N2MPW5_QUELO|nr:germin-like protein subfamily T member 2 [Quercus lobata]